MDMNKPVTNPELLEVMRNAKTGVPDERKLEDQLSKAKLLCPVTTNFKNTKQDGNGKVTVGEGSTFSILSLQNGAGEYYLMAFTDWTEVRKWTQEEKPEMLIMGIDDYRHILEREDSAYAGVTINPFGDNLLLNKEGRLKMNHQQETIKKDETVKIGIPNDYPVEMEDVLKRFFKKNRKVSRAYLLWMIRGEEGSYLLIVDAKEEAKNLYPMLGEVCRPYLNGKYVDIVAADSSFGQNVIKNQKPFYKRRFF